MRFIVDAQLPPAPALWLRDRGHDAIHLEELGSLTASDGEVWTQALETSAVLITKDHDFAEWSMARNPAPQIVWIRLGNLSNRALISRLADLWDIIVQRLNEGAGLVEAGRP